MTFASSLSTLGPFASGAAAVFVGMVASPILEYLKSQLAARRATLSAKRDLVVQLRVTLGYLDAFLSQLDRALLRSGAEAGWGEPDLTAWTAMQCFDFSPVIAKVDGLAALELAHSENSAVGQSLISRLLLTVSSFEQIKTASLVQYQSIGTKNKNTPTFGLDESGIKAVKYARQCNIDLRGFIVGPYSEILNIENRFSLVFDKRIMEFDRIMREHNLNNINLKISEAAKSSSETQARLNRSIEDSDSSELEKF
jgi:hypothetical protein